eukprot:scaffold94240_cov69-Phaeocystis_antarctica.AAC.1
MHLGSAAPAALGTAAHAECGQRDGEQAWGLAVRCGGRVGEAESAAAQLDDEEEGARADETEDQGLGHVPHRPDCPVAVHGAQQHGRPAVPCAALQQWRAVRDLRGSRELERSCTTCTRPTATATSPAPGAPTRTARPARTCKAGGEAAGKAAGLAGGDSSSDDDCRSGDRLLPPLLPPLPPLLLPCSFRLTPNSRRPAFVGCAAEASGITGPPAAPPVEVVARPSDGAGHSSAAVPMATSGSPGWAAEKAASSRKVSSYTGPAWWRAVHVAASPRRCAAKSSSTSNSVCVSISVWVSAWTAGRRTRRSDSCSSVSCTTARV